MPGVILKSTAVQMDALARGLQAQSHFAVLDADLEMAAVVEILGILGDQDLLVVHVGGAEPKRERAVPNLVHIVVEENDVVVAAIVMACGSAKGCDRRERSGHLDLQVLGSRMHRPRSARSKGNARAASRYTKRLAARGSLPNSLKFNAFSAFRATAPGPGPVNARTRSGRRMYTNAHAPPAGPAGSFAKCKALSRMRTGMHPPGTSVRMGLAVR